jgi:pimeloyl-ACP methyl ester carboxylesterase
MKVHRTTVLAICLTLASTGSARATVPDQAIPVIVPLPTMQVEGRATRAGASIWFGTIGKGAPVILLHGGLSSSRGWAGQVPAWSTPATAWC